jgi:hypothetical protein
MPRSHGTWPKGRVAAATAPFAGASTGSRSRSSSPRRASLRSVSMAWPPAWTTASDCSAAAAARPAPSPDDARDARLELRAAVRIRAGGPAPVGVFVGAFTLDAASASRRRRHPASDVAIRSRTWWASHSCRRMSAARSCTIACSRRRAPTRARSSSSASIRPRGATPRRVLSRPLPACRG